MPVKLSILTIISCVYQQHFQSFSRDGYHDFDGRTKTNGCNGAAPSIVYRQMAKSIPLYMMFELCDPNPTWDFRKHRNKLFNKINPKTGKKYHVTPVVAPTCQWYLDHGPFIRPSPGDGHDCFARQFFIRPGSIGRQTQVFHGPGLRHDGIPDGSMMEEMMTQGPVDYVIHATNRRFKSYKSGVTDAGCFCSGNHAVVAIGWGKEKGKEYVLTVNSWGKQWGEKGLVKAAWCHVLVWTSPGTITYTLHNTFKTTGFANQTFANQTSAKQGDP